MKRTKEDIVADWLPRYTGKSLDSFGEYVLLTNFNKYVRMFADMFGVSVEGENANMISATANNITIINFGMGSPNAALIMDMLSAIQPKAVLFLGKCGGLRDKNKIGDFILPIAAIRGEGTSDDYFPPHIPALPAFQLQRTTSSAIRDFAYDYWTGTVYTTNRRVWEHDLEFCDYLRKTRAQAVDMETATLFIVGFHNSIPTGALLLVSDMPLQADGIKTAAKDKVTTATYAEDHLKMGIKSLMSLQTGSRTVKHLRFD